MNTRIGLLGAALVVQLLLIALLVGWDRSGDATSAKLLDMDAEAVTRMLVSDNAGTIELTRSDDGWRFGERKADGEKAEELLSTFADLDAGWPVATTADSAKRFEVAADDFQRKLEFFAGEERVGEVFLGTSPRFERVHARVGGASEVFSVAFSSFKAPVEADDWLDKGQLGTEGVVQSIQASTGASLSRGAEGWLLNGAAADQESADGYAERFANLRVLGGADAVPSNAQAAGTIEIVDGEGAVTLSFHHETVEDDYFVTSTRVPGVFKVATYVAEQLLSDGSDLQAEPEMPLEPSDDLP